MRNSVYVLLAGGLFLLGTRRTVPTRQESPWWNERVFYEIFVRSFQDSDGDGIGDLRGLTSRLDYLNDGDATTDTDLGVTGIWLMPVMPSPSYHGYDVNDYFTIEENYGSARDFRDFVAAAHQRGIAVIIDLVLNHTSSEHPWFRASAAGAPIYRDWYLWREQAPEWRGPWGQRVWHPSGGSYYFGLFWGGMPDLNLEHPAVTARLWEITRFWLEEMGVDGFRLDAIKHLIEEGDRQENTPATRAWLAGYDDFIDGIDPRALTVGEIWSPSIEVASYVQGGLVDLAFEFDLAEAILQAVRQQSAAGLRETWTRILGAYPPGQFAPFLSNHDQTRVMTRLDGDEAAAGLAAALLLTAPGVPFLYYGEEIGLPGDKPDPRLRTPMPWEEGPGGGFTTGLPWQEPVAAPAGCSVDAQQEDPASLLSHYRRLIGLRDRHPSLRRGETRLVATGRDELFALLRSEGDEAVLALFNLSEAPVGEYRLDLTEGPLRGIRRSDLLLGTGGVTPPDVTPAGGFLDYRPRPVLPPRSTTLLLLRP